MGDDGNAGLTGFGYVRQEVRDFQKLIVALHPYHPILLEDRIVESIRPGERRSVGTCRARTEFGTANLNHDEGLAAFRRQPGYLKEFASILKAFDETGDHPGRGIIQ